MRWYFSAFYKSIGHLLILFVAYITQTYSIDSSHLWVLVLYTISRNKLWHLWFYAQTKCIGNLCGCWPATHHLFVAAHTHANSIGSAHLWGCVLSTISRNKMLSFLILCTNQVSWPSVWLLAIHHITLATHPTTTLSPPPPPHKTWSNS